MAPKCGSGRAFRVAMGAVAAVVVVAGLSVGATRIGAPDLASTVEQWTELHDGPQPYADVRIESDVPITMSDGAILKANVYRPVDGAGNTPNSPLPAIVTMTPYSKLMTNLIDSALALPGLQQLTMDLVQRVNLSGTPISGFGDLLHALDGGTVQTVLGVDRKLIRSGYTLVVVDVRGTGFSQGAWDTLGEREQLDTREVIDWAAVQPWSNGIVGMSGGSYAGINQLRAAENAPPALKAIFPVEPGSDLMRDVVAPGGGVGTTFLPLWLNTVNQSKMIPDVASMFNGTFDWAWLGERLADPMTNYDLLIQALTVPTMEELPPALGSALDSESAFRKAILGHPERITVPTFVYGGWHDIFANSATKIYNAIPLASEPVDTRATGTGAAGTGSAGAGSEGTGTAGTGSAAPTTTSPSAAAPTTNRPLVSNVAGTRAAGTGTDGANTTGSVTHRPNSGMKKLVVGDTYHANPGAGTGVPGAPPRLDVLQRAWLDYWLKDIDNGIDEFGPVVVFEQGGNWVTLPSFPQPGVTHRRVYLSPTASGTTADSLHDGSLTPALPDASESLTVAPGLSTVCSRDAAQGSAGMWAALDICAKDSRVAERNALTFTSPPVSSPTVISGPINAHLNTVHDAPDGYWSVTVNDVAPDGTSTVLTTGQLTASLRAVDESKSSRSPNGDFTAPYNPLTVDSHLPVTPGEPVALDIAVIPTQAVLAPGHRLRVDIFAGNAPKALAFRPMLNASGLKPQHLRLDPNAPSFINIPTDRPL
ncbi:CocE/NonD family hydrolase [Nocardia sp. NPDC050710]|uniref:CocE/NonD family hydrolase n=1 Tax=Nocardia sp. NPDC050710 TaxID=3157220 RepID=UPI00340BBE99